VLTIDRGAATGERVQLVANLTAERQRWQAPGREGRDGPPAVGGDARPPAWRVLLDSADPRFAGPGEREPLAPYQALLLEAARG